MKAFPNWKYCGDMWWSSCCVPMIAWWRDVAAFELFENHWLIGYEIGNYAWVLWRLWTIYIYLYPLVMTNSSPWEMALIEIDGLPNFKMVMASMAMLNMVSIIGNCLTNIFQPLQWPGHCALLQLLPLRAQGLSGFRDPKGMPKPWGTCHQKQWFFIRHVMQLDMAENYRGISISNIYHTMWGPQDI